MVPELNGILAWVEQLGEVDVTGDRADDRGDPQHAAPAR
jgi:Asp-tRNA(Asn)/Glu-tRNA(Gln) amidotransferase C subunit